MRSPDSNYGSAVARTVSLRESANNFAEPCLFFRPLTPGLQHQPKLQGITSECKKRVDLPGWWATPYIWHPYLPEHEHSPCMEGPANVVCFLSFANILSSLQNPHAAATPNAQCPCTESILRDVINASCHLTQPAHIAFIHHLSITFQCIKYTSTDYNTFPGCLVRGNNLTCPNQWWLPTAPSILARDLEA